MKLPYFAHGFTILTRNIERDWSNEDIRTNDLVEGRKIFNNFAPYEDAGKGRILAFEFSNAFVMACGSQEEFEKMRDAMLKRLNGGA